MKSLEPKRWVVTVPVAGHLTFEIQASTEAAAIEKALHTSPDLGELTYETLTSFHKGNVCYCPSPWKAEAEVIEP